MKQISNSIRIKLKRNKKILLFLGGLAIMGVIAGSLFFLFLRSDDQVLIKDYIENFLNTIREDKLVYFDTFKNTFFSNFVFSFLIFVFGISIVGLPLILLCYFIKCFIIGFSLSSFVFTYGLKGSLFSIIYFIPNFLYLVFNTILVVFAIKISIMVFYNVFSKKEISIKKITSKYVTYYLLLILIIFIIALLETFLVPFLLKSFLFIL